MVCACCFRLYCWYFPGCLEICFGYVHLGRNGRNLRNGFTQFFFFRSRLLMLEFVGWLERSRRGLSNLMNWRKFTATVKVIFLTFLCTHCPKISSSSLRNATNADPLQSNLVKRSLWVAYQNKHFLVFFLSSKYDTNLGLLGRLKSMQQHERLVVPGNTFW